MNELYQLRRNLLIRLVASQCYLEGCLQLVDDLLFGNATTVQAVIAGGRVSTDTLQAIANAKIRYANFCKGLLNIGGIGVNTEYQLGTSSPLLSYLNFGAIGIEHAYRIGKTRPLGGSIAFSSTICGLPNLDTPKRFTLGELIIEPEIWQASSTIDTNLQHVIGFLKKNVEAHAEAESVVNTSHAYGEIKTQLIAINQPTLFETVKQQRGILTIPILTSGKPNVRQQLYQIASDLNILSCSSLPAQATTGKPLGRHGEESVAVGLSGFIDLRITKVLYGVLPTGAVRAIGNIRTLQDIQSYPRTFFERAMTPIGVANVLQTNAQYGDLKTEISIQGLGQAARALNYESIFSVDNDGHIAICSIRSGGELMPLQRVFSQESFVAVTEPSYQQRSGINGQLIIPDDFSGQTDAELHSTMSYYVEPDEENGGDTYHIETKYHKNIDGIVSIGWQYFGYLIE